MQNTTNNKLHEPNISCLYQNRSPKFKLVRKSSNSSPRDKKHNYLTHYELKTRIENWFLRLELNKLKYNQNPVTMNYLYSLYKCTENVKFCAIMAASDKDNLLEKVTREVWCLATNYYR